MREDVLFLAEPEPHSSNEEGARHQRHGAPLEQILARPPTAHLHLKPAIIIAIIQRKPDLHLELCIQLAPPTPLLSEDGSWQ